MDGWINGYMDREGMTGGGNGWVDGQWHGGRTDNELRDR